MSKDLNGIWKEYEVSFDTWEQVEAFQRELAELVKKHSPQIRSIHADGGAEPAFAVIPRAKPIRVKLPFRADLVK